MSWKYGNSSSLRDDRLRLATSIRCSVIHSSALRNALPVRPVVRAEHANGDKVRLRRERSDDAGAGRPVTPRSRRLGRLIDLERIADSLDGDRASNVAYRRMPGVDAGVDHRDGDASPVAPPHARSRSYSKGDR
jgi:hypothetical protein